MEDESSFHHGEYVKSITPDVLAVINRVRFFELLDDRFCPLCPLGDVVESPKCAHSFDLTEGILAGLENDPEDIQDVLNCFVLWEHVVIAKFSSTLLKKAA
jgi:hypothetical protein